MHRKTFVVLCCLLRPKGVAPVHLLSQRFSAPCKGSVWPRFLIEFRGHQPYMRLDEFIDASAAVLGDDKMAEYVRSSLINVIPDPLSPHHDPICAYFEFPSAKDLARVVQRCCLVRSAIDVWGDGKSLEEVHQQALSSGKVNHYFKSKNISENSWRVNFRRFGRIGDSGLDPEEKRNLLSKFDTLLRSINGKVTLSGAKHKLLLLEDWSTFHRDVVIGKFSENKADTDLDFFFKPSRYLFGIKIAEGPSISSKFAVRNRPYIGTTTMDAISSHLAANAALTSEGHLILDPFCGTGSLLISASFLGGYVIGSDIDGDCLGVVNRTGIQSTERSKNANFRRKHKGRSDVWSQLNESASSNFNFYSLQDKLVSLMACNIEDWLTRDELTAMEFDAIISDPPFGKRERTSCTPNDNTNGSIDQVPSSNDVTNKFNEDSRFAITKILEVANQRLKLGGKLVFWLPTEANLVASDVESLLRDYECSVQCESLQFRRAKQQEINNSVWRWLCVYQKIGQEEKTTYRSQKQTITAYET